MDDKKFVHHKHEERALQYLRQEYGIDDAPKSAWDIGESKRQRDEFWAFIAGIEDEEERVKDLIKE